MKVVVKSQNTVIVDTHILKVNGRGMPQIVGELCNVHRGKLFKHNLMNLEGGVVYGQDGNERRPRWIS